MSGAVRYGVVRFGAVRFGTVRFGVVRFAYTLPKVGQGPKISALSRSYSRYSSVVVPRGLKEQKRWELHTPSVDWSTESSIPCDRGGKDKPTQYPSTRLLRKMLRKSLPSFLDGIHCCSLFNVLRSFSLNLVFPLNGLL